MKLAAQLYTVREFTCDQVQVYATLKKIKEIGYQCVQVSGLQFYDPAMIAEATRELGIEVCCTHTDYDRILNDTDAVIAEHQLFGCKYVGLGCFKRFDLESYKQLLVDLKPALRKFTAAGLKFLYHNHFYEWIKYDNVRPLDYLRDHTDPASFGFIADFYWIQKSGVFPLEMIEEYSGRIDVVHYKDFRACEESVCDMTEVFEGNMNYVKIHKACLNSGVRYAAVEQDYCDGDPFVSLKKSFDNLKKNDCCFENVQSDERRSL